jgi:hypothetical protein
MKATLANMRKLATGGHQFSGLPRIEAVSITTGERCSANPSDYWYLKDQDCLADAEGFDMELIEVLGTRQRKPRRMVKTAR